MDYHTVQSNPIKNTVRIRNIADEDACWERCRQNSNSCDFWVYAQPDFHNTDVRRNCFLKENFDPDTLYKVKSRVVSGFLECGELRQSNASCRPLKLAFDLTI